MAEFEMILSSCLLLLDYGIVVDDIKAMGKLTIGVVMQGCRLGKGYAIDRSVSLCKLCSPAWQLEMLLHHTKLHTVSCTSLHKALTIACTSPKHLY